MHRYAAYAAFSFFVLNKKNLNIIKVQKAPVILMVRIVRSMIGEALVGDGPEIAHIDLVIGPRGGPVETAFMN